MSTVIDSIEQRAIRKRPQFRAGDRVRVHFQVIEGERRRTQVFEGIVIKRQGTGSRETFTVRKNSFGVGVERTFPLHSPKVEKLEVAARGDVRRAKLYYLRDKVGRRARVAEQRWGIEDDVIIAEEGSEAMDSEGETVSEAQAEVTQPPEEEGSEGEGTEGDQAKKSAQADQGGSNEPAAEQEQEPASEATAEAGAGGEGKSDEASG